MFLVIWLELVLVVCLLNLVWCGRFCVCWVVCWLVCCLNWFSVVLIFVVLKCVCMLLLLVLVWLRWIFICVLCLMVILVLNFCNCLVWVIGIIVSLLLVWCLVCWFLKVDVCVDVWSYVRYSSRKLLLIISVLCCVFGRKLMMWCMIMLLISVVRSVLVKLWCRIVVFCRVFVSNIVLVWWIFLVCLIVSGNCWIIRNSRLLVMKWCCWFWLIFIRCWVVVGV